MVNSLTTKVNTLENILDGIQDGYISMVNTLENRLLNQERMMADMSARLITATELNSSQNLAIVNNCNYR